MISQDLVLTKHVKWPRENQDIFSGDYHGHIGVAGLLRDVASRTHIWNSGTGSSSSSTSSWWRIAVYCEYLFHADSPTYFIRLSYGEGWEIYPSSSTSKVDDVV